MIPTKDNTTVAAAAAALDRREAELLRDVEAARAAHADAEDAGREPGDSKDAADGASAAAIGDAERERDLVELHDIAAARRRIADGSYGRCVDCGAAIAAERLVAQPEAGRCIACQEAVEQAAAHGLRAPAPR